MIGFFPDPYPDELLYSVCARFSERVQYQGKSSVVRELFGTRNAVAVVDLPCRLGHLVETLPSKDRYTVNRLIDEHTLLPFYSPFCPPERINQVREDMKGTNGALLYGRLGILVSQMPQWLQFCSLCAQSDIKQFGECYWHRLHQVPGVKVCPFHAVFLEQSNAPFRHGRKPNELISAQRAIRATEPRELTSTLPLHSALLKIAQDADWLLSQGHLVSAECDWSRRYLRLLAECGLATYKGIVHARELLEAFKIFYTPDFLQWLDCSLNFSSQHHWLFRLTRFSDGKAQSPLHHLLLIQFLGYTAAEFFQIKSEFHPFSEGPWPCLNHASEHFGQLQIKECHITYNYHRPHRKPLGTFHCTCGFVYCRTGPDESELDRFRIDKLKFYGPIWEAVLKELWNDSSLSLREIARRLGVSFDTVKRHATRLNLPITRRGSQLTPLKDAHRLRSENAIAMASSTLETYRQEWQKVREENPEAGRKLLRTRFRRLYVWLERHDWQWFEAHLPPCFQRKGISPHQPQRVDWASRDAQLAFAVKDSALRLMKAPGRPIWITKTTIGRDIGNRTLIQKEIDKLPLTAFVLANVVETLEEYAIRRLKWATECFREEDICPKRWQLLQRASLKPQTVTLPSVKEAIELALASLAPLLTD